MNEQLMLEYIFFHEQPYLAFKKFLQARQVEPLREGVDQTDVEGYIVYLSDQLDDTLSEEIEAFYDEMMDMNEAVQMVAHDLVQRAEGLVH